MDCQGNLERTWEVRENSGNLKIISYGRQSSEDLVKRVTGVLSHEIVYAHLPPYWGLLL